MQVRETHAEIEEVAADWAARACNAPLSANEERDLEAWLAADSRRLGAYAKARAVFAHLRRAKGLGADFDLSQMAFASEADPVASSGTSRRRLLRYGGMAAAVVATTSVGGFFVLRGLRYETKRGEVRLLPLADSSLITLNTASRITVNFDDKRRTVHLEEGEALFDVAHDSERPFVVDAGDMLVRAVGTSFTVTKLEGRATQVLLREGVVEVRRHAAPHAKAVRVDANTRIVAAGDTAVDALAVAPAEISRELSWREGALAFENATLAEAAEQFARYNDTRIVFADPAIGRRTVTGLFSATNPVGFAEAVAATLDLHSETAPGEVRLLP